MVFQKRFQDENAPTNDCQSKNHPLPTNNACHVGLLQLSMFLLVDEDLEVKPGSAGFVEFSSYIPREACSNNVGVVEWCLQSP